MLTDSDQIILNELLALASDGKLKGEFLSIPASVYHHPQCPGISKSKLDLISRSWRHYEQRLIDEDKTTPALEFGLALHDIILLPAEFEKKYAQMIDIPKFDKRTKKGKFDHEQWTLETLNPFVVENQGKTFLSKDVMSALRSVKVALDEQPYARAIFSSGHPEVTYFWVDKKTGILCKCRTDWVNKDMGMIFDLKTTVDASMNAFRKSIANYKYDVQGGYYLDGVNQALDTNIFETFVFGAVEKEPPYELALYNLDEASLDVGRVLYQRSLARARRVMEGEHKGYPIEVQTINLPAWAFNVDDR